MIKYTAMNNMKANHNFTYKELIDYVKQLKRVMRKQVYNNGYFRKLCFWYQR